MMKNIIRTTILSIALMTLMSACKTVEDVVSAAQSVGASTNSLDTSYKDQETFRGQRGLNEGKEKRK